MNCIAVRAMTPYVPQKSCTGRPCKIGMPLRLALLAWALVKGCWTRDNPAAIHDPRVADGLPLSFVVL